MPHPLLERLSSRFSGDTAHFERALGADLPRLPIHTPTRREAERLSLSEQRYVIDAPTPRVFDIYQKTHPRDVWPRDRIAYRYAYAPGSSQKVDDERWPGLHEGLRIFADLFVDGPRGRLRIFVPVMVTSVKPNESIRYDYLKGAVTMGYNEMIFTERASGARPSTGVHHVSMYRGTSAVHRAMMPLLQRRLHVGFVDALHAAMKALIEREDRHAHV